MGSLSIWLRLLITNALCDAGMGRSIHTNYNTKFKCDALKLAMIKNKHLAQRLFKGDVYDCVCRFDNAHAF